MKKPYRILNIFMILDRGGAETFVMNIYRNIDRTKIQFDFLVHGDKKGAFEDEIISMGGKIYRLPNMGVTNLPNYNKAIDEFFRMHAKDYRVIHSHASELGYFILKKAKKYDIPYRVCHAHSAPQGLTIRNIIRNCVKKLNDKYTNVRFACSEVAGVWQYGKSKEFKVLNNGIEVDKFKYNAETRKALRSLYHIDDNQLVVGHVGRFEKPKNHDFLIEVFEQLLKIRNNATLILIGDGSLRNSIEKKVIDKGIEKHVVFMGVKENVYEYMQMMDVFLFPSIFEGLPVSLIEAQSTGLKCFASDKITKEVKLTDLVEYISLEKHTSEWAKILNSFEFDYDREHYYEIAKKSGYNICISAQKLESFYMDCYGESVD